MNDGLLSQEEINALLTGEGAATTSGEPPTEPVSQPAGVTLSDFEKDALGEIGNISMGTSATTLSTLLGKKVQITTPHVTVVSRQEIKNDHPFPYVVVEVAYTEGFDGMNALYVSERDAAIIANLMMGGDGHVETVALDEISLSAVSEAMNQMIGSATTSMSSMFGIRLDISPPAAKVIDLSEDTEEAQKLLNENVVNIRFRMIIEGLIDSEIMQIVPLDAAKQMVSLLMGETSMTMPEETPAPEPAAAAPAAAPEPLAAAPPAAPPLPEPPAAPYPAPGAAYPPPGAYPPPAAAYAYPPPYYMGTPAAPPGGVGSMPVQPVQFMELENGGDLHLAQSINLIMDIPLDVTVQLGQTHKTIKEVLELTEGSIIQLDKLAGEAVELMVNGKLIARGEVVVIDENYGIRITSILSPIDRVEKIQ
jgi:flagellar motor switch protein FliN/FliY